MLVHTQEICVEKIFEKKKRYTQKNDLGVKQCRETERVYFIFLLTTKDESYSSFRRYEVPPSVITFTRVRIKLIFDR